MAERIKTRLHTFAFTNQSESERAKWRAFRAEKAALLPHVMEAIDCVDFSFSTAHDGAVIELETRHLFANQWNTAPILPRWPKGKRVFDFAINVTYHNGVRGKARSGYWLEQTAEMRELRRNTHKCGYCGKQEPAAKGNVFCPHCLDSEYLTQKDLPLTRMSAIDQDTPRREIAPLSEAEAAHLLPLFRQAQIHGSTERGRARMAKKRADVIAHHAKVIHNATTERDGFLWLLDRGINADNVIYYNHTGRFGFGWRKPLDQGELSLLLESMGAEFNWPYDIKCADGRTLSGE